MTVLIINNIKTKKWIKNFWDAFKNYLIIKISSNKDYKRIDMLFTFNFILEDFSLFEILNYLSYLI